MSRNAPKEYNELSFLDNAQATIGNIKSLAATLYLAALQTDDARFADVAKIIENETCDLRDLLDGWEAGSFAPRREAARKAEASAPKAPEYRDDDLITRLQRVIAAQRKLPRPPKTKKGGAA